SDVPADEAQTDIPENPPEPPKETVPDFNLNLAMAPQPKPPAPRTPAPKPAQQQASPRTDQRAPSSAASSQGTGKPAAARPSPPPPAAMMPPPAAADPVQLPAPEPKETDFGTKVADLFGMPLAMPDGRLGGGFDAPAYQSAKIERSSVDA